MNKWRMVPVYPNTHEGVAKLLFGDLERKNMTRAELLKCIKLMAAEAKDLTGSYPADEAKQAKKRINRTLRALKLLLASTSDKVIAQL